MILDGTATARTAAQTLRHLLACEVHGIIISRRDRQALHACVGHGNPNHEHLPSQMCRRACLSVYTPTLVTPSGHQSLASARAALATAQWPFPVPPSPLQMTGTRTLLSFPLPVYHHRPPDDNILDGVVLWPAAVPSKLRFLFSRRSTRVWMLCFGQADEGAGVRGRKLFISRY